ncbi:hypothetical protein [Virgibacillus subterraneus]|nr:hypothetical protein [Virgibacillus subterraneus]
MLKISDDEVKRTTDAIFGKEDYAGLIVGITIGIGLIFIGLFSMFII